MAALLAACSSIGEDERLIYVEPVVPIDTTAVDDASTDSLYDAPIHTVARRVLIEDHTGQLCPNCPAATSMIHEFQQLYGDLIVPVAIHSKALGIMEEDGGLGNELGNYYYSQWNVTTKPSGLISRLDGGAGRVMDRSIWPAALNYAVALETPLDIRVKAALADDGQTAQVDVKVLCTREESAFSGRLQVWITEDSIVALQDSMGTRLPDYVHNHVLRAAVNGQLGEDISLSTADSLRELHYEPALSAAWKPAHLSVVAFAYDDGGVMQAVRRQLKTKE